MAAIYAPKELCLCASHQEALLLKYAIRFYGVISMGVGSLFVLIGAFGSAIN
ncbi:MAG: hypothetical protein ACYCQJ_07660 [Nitrososphaerales archaeon]